MTEIPQIQPEIPPEFDSLESLRDFVHDVGLGLPVERHDAQHGRRIHREAVEAPAYGSEMDATVDLTGFGDNRYQDETDCYQIPALIRCLVSLPNGPRLLCDYAVEAKPISVDLRDGKVIVTYRVGWVAP